MRHRAGRALALGLALVACLAPNPAAALTRFEGEGRVIAIDVEAGVVTIDHAAIPGLLAATRTRFAIERPELGGSVRAGEYVRFTVAATDESHGRLTLVALSTTRRLWLESVPRGILAALAVGLVGLAAAAGIGLWRTMQDLRKRTESVAYEVRHARQGLLETREELHGVARAMDAVATTVLEGYLKDIRRRIAAARGAVAESIPGLIVVRRGRMDVYRALDGAPGARVIWDRRVAERRARRQAVVSERRRAERRRPAPEAWSKLGFALVVEPAGMPTGEAAEPLPSRPARVAGFEPPL